MVRVDPVLFEQVLFNLLDNAAKYAPEGSTIASKGGRCLQRHHPGLDEGRAFRPGDLERVFDTFYRVRKGDQVAPEPASAFHLPWLHRGDGRHDHGQQPQRPLRERSSPSAFRNPTIFPNWMNSNDRLTVKILVVDDEPPIRKLLRVGLAAQGYVVRRQRTPRRRPSPSRRTSRISSSSTSACRTSPATTCCRKWRDEGCSMPVVILSSRTDEAGIVKALETGADDYVTKPFGMNELGARIRVALRHRLQQQGEKAIFQTGGLSIDLVKRIVKVDGRKIKLSPKEYDILRVIAQHAGKVLTHQHLLKQVWGPAADVQYLRVYVRQLRQKVEKFPDQPHGTSQQKPASDIDCANRTDRGVGGGRCFTSERPRKAGAAWIDRHRQRYCRATRSVARAGSAPRLHLSAFAFA
jgi:two-component system KDP operon response regulator KdpE